MKEYQKSAERIVIEELLEKICKTGEMPSTAIELLLNNIIEQSDENRRLPLQFFNHRKTAIPHYHIVVKLDAGELVLPKQFATKQECFDMSTTIADLFRIDEEYLYYKQH